MNTRIALIGLAGLIGAGAITAGVIVALDDDPTRQVDSIALGDVSQAEQRPTSTIESAPSDDSSSPSTTLVTSAVEGLEELTGQLRAGSDADEWYVADVDVDFGPDGWLQTTEAPDDFDGDGTVGTIIEELRGLDGTEVDLGVRFERDDNDRDDADVFTINGLEYRDPTASSAPWQTPSGDPASRDAVVDAALTAVGAGSTLIEIDADDEDGFAGWEVEVRSSDNQRYEVLVTATGLVADVRPYDDRD
jgi:uncharacterized membrane protein YkoI